MKKLILLVGIPASGKTTLSQHLVSKGFVCLSADTIRQNLWGDSGNQREPEKVFEIFFDELEKELKSAHNIVIDNTNINNQHRKPIIERALQAGYTDIQLWVLDTPLELCLERNKKRTRIVPNDILVNMHNTLHGPGKPRTQEGKIIVVKPGTKSGEFCFFAVSFKQCH